MALELFGSLSRSRSRVLENLSESCRSGLVGDRRCLEEASSHRRFEEIERELDGEDFRNDPCRS